MSLALSGDGTRIAVGIDEGSFGFGALRVFDLESTTGSWKATDVLPPDACRCSQHYGSAVALSSDGKTLVVGNWGVEPTVMPRSGGVTSRGPGHAWVYRLVNGGWQVMQSLESSSPVEGGEFGDILATSADGRIIAVNASREDAVHLFREADGRWTESHRLTTPSPVSRDFGGLLALSGDGSRLMIGMPIEPTTAVGTVGSLCAPTERASNGLVYGFDDDGRSFRAFLRPRVHHRAAAFGLGLAISGDGRTLAVGAPGEDSAALGVDGDQNDHSAPNSGAVYLFRDSLP